MGFAGNVEPCFITPTVVAVNESFLNQSRSTSKGNWLAQHSAGVMADLDFFIGDEALSRSRSSSTYNLSYPIHHGQVEYAKSIVYLCNHSSYFVNNLPSAGGKLGCNGKILAAVYF